MTNQTQYAFTYEPKVLADHKRSYGIQRKNLETGKKTKMEFYTYNQFASFEAYLQNLEVTLASSIESRVRLLVPEFDKSIAVEIFGTGNYGTLAKYMGMKDGVAKLAFRLSHLVDTFYHAYADDHRNVAHFTESIDHELRHHIDRRHLKKSHMMSNLAKSKLPNDTDDHNATARVALDYVRMLRTEGFGMFSGNGFEQITDLSMLEPMLKNHTSAATLGLQMLDVSPTIPKLDWFNFTRAFGFNAYDQGHMLFKVIELSKLMKLQNIEPTRPSALVNNKAFDRRGLCENNSAYRQTLNEIAQQTTYGDFINYYNDAAQMLRLDEKELILTPSIADRFITFEKEAANMESKSIEEILQIGGLTIKTDKPSAMQKQSVA